MLRVHYALMRITKETGIYSNCFLSNNINISLCQALKNVRIILEKKLMYFRKYLIISTRINVTAVAVLSVTGIIHLALVDVT